MKKILAISLLVISVFSYAQDRFANVEISSQAVAGSVHMLQGSGGNIGVSVGEDGLLIIDDQYAPLAEKIAKKLTELGEKAPRYIINTHYHGDHTGSNAFFHENRGATIFAHENVRIRLASGNDVDAASLPVITYKDGVKFHLNGDTIHVFHLPSGHTDGDSVVWFEQANVLHTGDLFFNDMFPYIDLGAGGTVKGYIASVETLLTKINNDTKLIPGHGKLANKADLQKFLDMIKQTYAFVQAQKGAGMSQVQVLEVGLDEKWKVWSWQFINEEKMDKNPLPRIIDKHGLSLRAASDEDYAYLQSWFTNKREVLLWAGPSLPFPLPNDAFIEYLLSSHYFSYAMHSNSHLIGFGQYQLHKNHMHLGRLAINPKCRKQGLSYTLVNKLITMGTKQSPEVIKTVSLFVFKTNKIATTAYVNLGFVACRLPKGIKPVEGCQYMLMFL